MYRRRRYSRVPRSVKSVKYSNETAIQSVPQSTAPGVWNAGLAVALVPSVNSAGMRKAKNFTLSFQYQFHFQDLGVPINFALVYVPEGQVPGTLGRAAWSNNSAPVSLYEPNQNVILQGLLPATCTGRMEFRTRLARNLNSGDAIYLVMRPIDDLSTQASESGEYQGIGLCAQLNYAIAY